MVVRLLSGKPLLHVLNNEALEKILRLFGMLRERLVLEVELTLDDVAYDFKLRITRERDFAAQHDVKHDSHGPDIDLLVVVLKENFRRDVVWLNFVNFLMCSDLPSHSSSS